MEAFLRVMLAMSVCVLALSANAIAQNISGVVNTYAAVRSINTANATIDIESATGFSAGDQVLLIQMMGAAIVPDNTPRYGEVLDMRGAGMYEFGTVGRIDGNRVTLQKPLVHSAYNVAGRVQLVRVPQYDRAVVVDTLTCKPWDGATGGVLALSAGCLILQSDMDVSRAGYRGAEYQHQTGCAINPNNAEYVSSSACRASLRGEGIAGNGIGAAIYGKGAAANSGGGGNNHNAGGGGGGNYGMGGQGGFGYENFGDPTAAAGMGGRSLSVWSGMAEGVFMGGGGGGGHINDRHGSGGANGGGIIFLRAGTVDGGDHTVRSRGGGAADDPAMSDPDGCGGGGAGGSVVLDIGSITRRLAVDVSGGDGGSRTGSMTAVGPGGGGGGGLVALTGDTVGVGCLLVRADAGTAGTAMEGGTYGAEDAMPGALITRVRLAGDLPELRQCDTAGECIVLDLTPVLPPVITPGANNCYGMAIVAIDSAFPIIRVELDSLASSNTSIASVDGLFSREVTVHVQVHNRSKSAYITLRAINERGKQSAITTTVTVVSGSPITVLGIKAERVQIDTTATRTRRCTVVELRNDDTVDLVIPSAAFLRNLSFSVPPSQFPLVVPPGATRGLEVCFEPEAGGADSDTLIVADLCPLHIPMWSFGSFSGEGMICTTPIRVRQAMPGAAKVSIAAPHPNPGSATVDVPVEILGDRDAALAGAPVLRDAFGSVMRSPEYTLVSHTGSGNAYREHGSYRLDVADLPQGLYWLMIPTVDGVVSRPIMVVR